MGLSLAFQEVGAEFMLKPGTARRRGAVPFALGLSLCFPLISLFRVISLGPLGLYHAHIPGSTGQARGFILHALSRYGRVAPGNEPFSVADLPLPESRPVLQAAVAQW